MWLKINNHRLNLDDISTFVGDKNALEVTTRGGRRYDFTGEPAAALELFLSTLPGLIDLGDGYRKAKAAVEEQADRAVQKQADEAPWNTTRCPLAAMHPKFTLGCPSCGAKTSS
jgi:hypothetical protein